MHIPNAPMSERERPRVALAAHLRHPQAALPAARRQGVPGRHWRRSGALAIEHCRCKLGQPAQQHSAPQQLLPQVVRLGRNREGRGEADASWGEGAPQGLKAAGVAEYARRRTAAGSKGEPPQSS